MDGYKVVYKEPDGTITHTLFGEPMANFSLSGTSNIDAIKFVFGLAYPDCEIVSIECGSLEEFMK